MVYDMGHGEYVLCRVVLKLQRFTLIDVEDHGLCWIFSDSGKYLLPTEPAEEGLAERHQRTECETHSYVDFSRAECPIVSFTMDVTPTMADTIRGLYGIPAGIFNPHDLTDDPGTPPDLR